MKLPHRRRFLHLVASAATLPAVSRMARADTYPTRPVHLIVGFAAGGAPDIVARIMGQRLSERLGQPFIVDDRPGAASNSATETVVRAPPDGYTLLLVTSTNTTNAALYDKLSFDFSRDIAPVGAIIRVPFVMVVSPSVPAKTVPEFIAYSKANPGKITMASAGIGSTPHVFGELFKSMTGIDMLHVPYRANYYPDLLSGQVQVAFSPIPGSIGYIRTDKLRVLAVTSATRSDALPDIPTVGDFVPGYEASGWSGISAPRNTPIEIVDNLNKEINLALADPKMKERLADLGGVPMPMTPADFRRFIAEDIEKWTKVIQVANIKLE
jgi:tripartite-type tricarboxylate transporter receptor subunit TctC